MISSQGSGATNERTIRTVSATDSPEVTSLGVIDDWDESDRCKVNPIVGQAGVAAGAGAVGATVQRTTLASDDPAVTALQVIDDWDESDRAKVNPIVGQAGIAAGAGAVGATVPRVTLASDDPGVASLGVMDDWDESDRAKVNPIVGQAGIAAGAGAVGVTVPRVTLASDDPGVASLGVIDDWDESDRCKVNLIAGQAGVSAGAGNVDASTIRVTLASNGSLGSCSNTDDAAIGTAGLSIVAKGKTSQRAAVSDGDAVQVVANAYGELVQAGYAWTTNSTRAEEINPLSTKYLGTTEASAAGGSANTYNYYLDMAGYSKLGLQFQVTAVSGTTTIKIYGSMQDDLTVPASCTYQDITTTLFGVASFTATGMALAAAGNAGLFKYIKVEVVTTGTDTFTIYAKRMY